MAAGEEADQELMRRLLLADDDLRQLALDPAAALVDLLDDLAFALEDSSAVVTIAPFSRSWDGDERGLRGLSRIEETTAERDHQCVMAYVMMLIPIG